MPLSRAAAETFAASLLLMNTHTCHLPAASQNGSVKDRSGKSASESMAI